MFNNRSASQSVRQNSVRSVSEATSDTLNPLDQLSSAEIAAQVATLLQPDVLSSNAEAGNDGRMAEAVAVRNQADSENAQLAIIPSDTSIVAKPQIVGTSQKSKKNIVRYKSVEGDTLDTVAAKFGINSNSVKWSNGLTATKIAAGTNLLIPPANGIAYTVKSGDTVDKVVSKFDGNKDLFITVNDAESGSLVVGDVVWIPNGIQVVRYSQASSAGFAWGGFAPVYGSNGYDYGYCTWYVANRRAGIGRPVPGNLGNASTWKVLAQRAGFATGPTPQPGAVAWTVPRDYYGHVAFVEEVYADGSFKVSEMNTAGWARVSSKIVPASGVSGYYFIY